MSLFTNCDAHIQGAVCGDSSLTIARSQGRYSCREQFEFGKCYSDWMLEGGYCNRTCYRCNCTGTAVTRAPPVRARPAERLPVLTVPPFVPFPPPPAAVVTPLVKPTRLPPALAPEVERLVQPGAPAAERLPAPAAALLPTEIPLAPAPAPECAASLEAVIRSQPELSTLEATLRAVGQDKTLSMPSVVASPVPLAEASSLPPGAAGHKLFLASARRPPCWPRLMPPLPTSSARRA